MPLSWVPLAQGLSLGCYRCWPRLQASQGLSGENLLPDSLTWLLAGLKPSLTVGWRHWFIATLAFHGAACNRTAVTACFPQKEGSKIPWVSQSVKVLVTQLCLTLWDPVDCSVPGSSVLRISQARTLEWVAILFSRRIFPTQGSKPVCTAGKFFTIWATRNDPKCKARPFFIT